MNIKIFKGRKLLLQLLLIISFFWTDINCQFNLYDTDQRFLSDTLQYDCLNYYIYWEKLAYQELSDVTDETISYCFRPDNNSKKSTEISVGPHSAKLNFKQIRMLGITVLQLFLWSIPIETIERYQLYLTQPNTALNEQFYNCTSPWFGVYCQYSFELGGTMSFNEIVEHQFVGRASFAELSNIVAQVPCYVLLECHRHGQKYCLDWREICDGNIDCFDESLDEENCFGVEINNCKEGEYQCHNGLCISEDLWEDGLGETECLDRSDSDVDFSFIDSCYRDPSFRCEEHSCRADDKSFACGDGQCVHHLTECHNGRHQLLMDSFAVQGNLKNECWMAMVCLTGFDRKCNRSLSKFWPIYNKTILSALQQCDSFFNFPTVPVHSNHVYLLFENPWKQDVKTLLLPDYVCYSQQLCDSITPEFIYKNQTCVRRSSLPKLWDAQLNPWAALIRSIKEYFIKSCSVFVNANQNEINLNKSSSWYQCPKSLKFIPIHRIMDGLADCPENEDEKYGNSCQLNDRFRTKCIDETKCWSPFVKNHACLFNHYDTSVEISFETFCDGIKHNFYDNDRQKHNDEFGCGNWSCNNMYTRCDGYWTCRDGRDEDECGQQIRVCPPHTYACISPNNFSVSCLRFDLVNDGIEHCLGKLDEQFTCRTSYPSKEVLHTFHCSEEEGCLSLSQLCNHRNDCLNGDDEIFCKNQPLTCDQNSLYKYTDAEKVICELKKIESRRVKYFSIHTSLSNSSEENYAVGDFNHWPQQRRRSQTRISDQEKNNSMSWLCNRGIMVRTRTKDNTTEYACLCSPSYYGTWCQYQSQRISISLKISSTERSATYAIVIMLVDDNDKQQQIEAYDQFTYVVKETCSVELGRYLLFPTRPKNISKNYSIRIDAFEKNTLSYIESWHHSIDFLFLPVNRFGISLNLSNHLLATSFDCSTTCNNGQCTKYVNKDMSFCRCFPGWTGLHCNISVALKCQRCSSDSLCIGSTNNRSVCVCPIGKFGPRCLFTSTCPSNACQNNGQCLSADISILGNNFTCLCPVQFFGQFCQYRKARLDVSLDGIPAPPYLVAHFFTLSNQSDPIETIILRKFTLFQHSVSFHIAVPFQLVFVEADRSYYLAALQQTPKSYILASITPAHKCESTDRLLNSTVLEMIPYRRILYFHLLCQNNFHLTCFIDKVYLCLCTIEHHANCLPFNSNRHFQCPLNNICQNQGRCLQDHQACPSTKICLCQDCFFGNKCQYYARGMGATLDEILGYEIKSNTKLSEQLFAVKFTVAVTITMFVVGMINSVICMFVFSRKASREVGCGIYLLSSSITSMIITILYTMKFWLLFISYQNVNGQRYVREASCYGVEPLLQIFLQYDRWLNAFVALERATAALKGVTFNKNRSKMTAIFVIPISFVIVGSLLVPPLTRLHLFYDEIEERTWCVVKYVEWMQVYRTAFIHIYYFIPLLINIVSMVLIVTITAQQKYNLHHTETYMFHVQAQMKKNKHILISTITVVVLTLPHLIISFLLECQKSSHIFWLSLIGYFLSLFPATFIFFIFALPSPLYKKQFNVLVKLIRKRQRIWKSRCYCPCK